MMLQKPRLSFVVPAYNEALAIEETLNALDDAVKETGFKYEIIVVDDGSKDGTVWKATRYASRNGHVRVIRYEKNMGKGHAIKTGSLHVTGDAIVFLDGDKEIDPKQVTRYIEALKYGDIVIASKRHPQSKVEMPKVRRVLSYAFNKLVRLLTGVKISDTQTGLKAIKKDVFKKILPKLNVKRYAFDVELLVIAKLYGFKVVELPVNVKIRSIFSFKEVWRMLVDLLGITYRLRISKQY
jgi:glycosyltransferase involved in cell wall biosynthesis